VLSGDNQWDLFLIYLSYKKFEIAELSGVRKSMLASVESYPTPSVLGLLLGYCITSNGLSSGKISDNLRRVC